MLINVSTLSNIAKLKVQDLNELIIIRGSRNPAMSEIFPRHQFVARRCYFYEELWHYVAGLLNQTLQLFLEKYFRKKR